MRVREGMTKVVLAVGPDHSVAEVARQMAARRVAAAVVTDPDLPGHAIITERDVVLVAAAGQDPERERVRDHMSSDVVYADPEWSLEEAAVTMVHGGFRHLVVVEGGTLAGVLSMRDIVRCWTDDGSSCELPQPAGGTVVHAAI